MQDTEEDPTGPSTDDIDGFLAWTLVRVARQVERTLTDVIADEDLTATQFGVLAHLAARDDLSQSDLARSVLVRPQTIGPLMTSLTERGLVTRPGPGGRGRRAAVVLTDRGRDTVQHAWARVTTTVTPAALGLAPNQAATLDHLLHAIGSSFP